MTFEAFKASMRREGRDWLEKELGMEARDSATGFRVYGDDVYIEEIGDSGHLLDIEGEEFRTPETSLEEMERILFDWLADLNGDPDGTPEPAAPDSPDLSTDEIRVLVEAATDVAGDPRVAIEKAALLLAAVEKLEALNRRPT